MSWLFILSHFLNSSINYLIIISLSFLTVKSCGVLGLGHAGGSVDGEVKLLRQLDHGDVIAVLARTHVVLVVGVACHRHLLLGDRGLPCDGEVVLTNSYLEIHSCDVSCQDRTIEFCF